MTEKLKEAILGKGQSAPNLRKKIFTKVENMVAGLSSSALEPSELNVYVEKVANAAYTVVDDDVEKLKAKGFSEDEIYELTIAAAAAAGLGRLKKGRELLKKVSNHEALHTT